MSGDEWSFRCSACGKCCNSAPELSVPELFHHQHRFVGRLALKRVRRLAARPREPDPPGWDLLLVTQGHTEEGSGRCPALADDGRCSLQDDRKPAVCVLVPLDALVPDQRQHELCALRAREADYLGAGCIVPGKRPDFTPLVRGLRVVDPAAQAALARRRAELALEKRHWGNAVFRLLGPELLARGGPLARLTDGGTLSLPITPVLLVLADVSPACLQRCVEYVDAQLGLCERLGRPELARPLPALRESLSAEGPHPRWHGAEVAATEAWLGLERAA